MKSLTRRAGLPALFLAGALLGSALTGMAVAGQPHMQNALNSLNTAKTELTAADADKGGHRDKALSDVNAAITQVNAGIAYAATNK